MAKEIVDKCEGCQFYSNMSHKPASALKTIPLAWPFVVWGLDMVGPLRTGRSGFTYVLVAVDKFTKWIEAKPIKNLDAGTAISFIRELIFRYGVPHSIIIDKWVKLRFRPIQSLLRFSRHASRLRFCRSPPVEWTSRKSKRPNSQRTETPVDA